MDPKARALSTGRRKRSCKPGGPGEGVGVQLDKSHFSLTPTGTLQCPSSSARSPARSYSPWKPTQLNPVYPASLPGCRKRLCKPGGLGEVGGTGGSSQHPALGDPYDSTPNSTPWRYVLIPGLNRTKSLLRCNHRFRAPLRHLGRDCASGVGLGKSEEPAAPASTHTHVNSQGNTWCSIALDTGTTRWSAARFPFATHLSKLPSSCLATFPLESMYV